jgi:hypothetical protein
MQEDTNGQAMLPNRKERRRLAALTKRPARPTCACCQPTQRKDDRIEQSDGGPSRSGLSLA